MTTQNKQHVKMPMAFDPKELEARFEAEKTKHLEGYYNERQWMYPAAIIESMPTLQMLIELVVQKEKKGQSLYPHGEQAVAMPGYYSAHFWKPIEEIEADLESLKVKVEQGYKQEIESFNAAQLELLTQQLLAQEQAKERKKQEEKEAKQLAQVKADAEAYFSSLNKKESK